MTRRTAALLCGAVLLLCLGLGAGRYSALRGGAVLTSALPGIAMPALEAALPAESGGDVLWRVNLNTAGALELEELPGIGPSIAGRIVAYRQENGGFETLEELMAVKGIGEAVFAKLKDYITIE